jgi:uncharacterized membrane protein
VLGYGIYSIEIALPVLIDVSHFYCMLFNAHIAMCICGVIAIANTEIIGPFAVCTYKWITIVSGVNLVGRRLRPHLLYIPLISGLASMNASR